MPPPPPPHPPQHTLPVFEKQAIFKQVPRLTGVLALFLFRITLIFCPNCQFDILWLQNIVFFHFLNCDEKTALLLLQDVSVPLICLILKQKVDWCNKRKFYVSRLELTSEIFFFTFTLPFDGITTYIMILVKLNQFDPIKRCPLYFFFKYVFRPVYIKRILANNF